jgi:glycosyltransferase involved in cell wall biosynthesis
MAADGGRLALFFTRGVSLETWERNGSLERELALYRALGERLDEVALLTYGGAAERRYGDRIGNLTLLPNERRLPALAYEALLPVLRSRDLRRMTVLKTNQLTGGRAALRARRLHGVPLITRCGYLRTEVEPPGSMRWRLSRLLERTLFRGGDIAVVTTERLREVVLRSYGVEASRVRVVPNPVDLELFRPPPGGHTARLGVVYVGRLAPEKRIDLLIDAVARLDGVPLRIVGTGPLEASLRARAERTGVEAEFLGVRPNAEVARIVASSAVFALTSSFEGHPKALIEAMATGAAVVGTDVPGIRDAVRDEVTGLLAPGDPSSLAERLEQLLGDEGLRRRLGDEARAEVSRRYALDHVVELELDAIDAARAAWRA